MKPNLRRCKPFLSKFGLLSLILPSTLVLAQVQTPVSCGQALQSVDKDAAACAGVGNNQVCLANPSVVPTFQTSAITDQITFAKAGDSVGLNTIQSLTTSALDLTQNQWGMAVIKAGIADPNANSSGVVGPAVTVVQYGLATMTLAPPVANTSSATPEVTPTPCLTTVKVASLLRAAPINGKIVQTLQNGAKITLYGRLTDSSWVLIDNNGQSGWLLATSFAALSGDCATGNLPIINPNTTTVVPELVGFTFSIGDSSGVLCRDIPAGGLFLQSPTGRKVALTVDGAQLTLNAASIVLTAIPNQKLNIAVIDGAVSVKAHNDSIDVPIGKQVSIPLGGAAGLDVIGVPGKLTTLQEFSGSNGIYLNTLCGLASAVSVHIPCTLAAPIHPTTVPVPVNTLPPNGPP